MSIYIAEMFLCLEWKIVQCKSENTQWKSALLSQVTGSGPIYELFLIAMLCWLPLCADKLWAN